MHTYCVLVDALTANNQRFLGYKAYVLLFFKLVSIGINVLIANLCVGSLDSVVLFVVLINITFVVYCVMLVLFASNYRKAQQYQCMVNIHYTHIVHRWWIEGTVSQSDI